MLYKEFLILLYRDKNDVYVARINLSDGKDLVKLKCEKNFSDKAFKLFKIAMKMKKSGLFDAFIVASVKTALSFEDVADLDRTWRLRLRLTHSRREIGAVLGQALPTMEALARDVWEASRASLATMEPLASASSMSRKPLPLRSWRASFLVRSANPWTLSPASQSRMGTLRKVFGMTDS